MHLKYKVIHSDEYARIYSDPLPESVKPPVEEFQVTPIKLQNTEIQEAPKKHISKESTWGDSDPLSRLVKERTEILNSTNYPPEVMNILIQDVLRRMSDLRKHVKEEPINVNVTSKANGAVEKPPSKANENFDFTRFAKPAQNLLKFFVDHNAAIQGDQVSLGHLSVPRAQFEDGIRKLSDGRFALSRNTYPWMFDFLEAKGCPMDILPRSRRVFFQPPDDSESGSETDNSDYDSASENSSQADANEMEWAEPFNF